MSALGSVENAVPGSSAASASVTIHEFNHLGADKEQEVALKAISELNKTISTDGGKTTWENYTRMLVERPKDNLYIARVDGIFAGYVAFYTKKDCVYSASGLEDGYAYCSWTAVEEKYRKLGVATRLKLHLFEKGFKGFKGQIKIDNEASIGSAKKLGGIEGLGCRLVSTPTHVYYTIYKKD